MTGRNTLKARINSGETVTAAWLEIGSPDVAELLVHCGWDVVVIDCEHGTFGLEEGLNMIRAVEAAGGQAVVRVPDSDDATLKRALDRGARSIMVPMVQSADEARRIADACLYPARGRRGYAAPIVRASGYGAVADYARNVAHGETLLMVQIEHPDAITHVSEIAQIEGVDMVFIGPNDLAAAMGFLEDMDRPEVHDALATIEKQVRDGGLKLGTVLGAGRDYKALKLGGYSLIVGPCDIAMLAEAARTARRACDETIG
jgi:4-hydroxy-2-oxoheptanedioate aldolase